MDTIKIPTEHDEQVKVIRWCDAHPDPRVSRIYSHLNGLRASIGAVIKAKASGGRKGIPDLFLPIPCGGFHGLYIEMKRTKGGSLTPEQKDWIKFLGDSGYKAAVCKGHESAIEVIKKYLEL